MPTRVLTHADMHKHTRENKKGKNLKLECAHLGIYPFTRCEAAVP